MGDSCFIRARRAPALGVVLGAAVALAAPAGAQPLNDAIQRQIDAVKLGPEARVGVCIIDEASGAVLASIRAGEAFVPASNQKLLTSGAALLVLGPEFVFTTELVRSGDDLAVIGSGDPALADPDVLDRLEPRLTVDDLLATMADSVARAGITRAARLVVDDRVFDRQLVHPSWPERQLGDWYCAQVSGVSFHANVISVFPRPSPDGPGHRATFTVQPGAPWLSIENRAVTRAQGQNAISLVRVGDGNQFRMSGDVRAASQAPVETTVNEPALFFGQLLADRVEAAGVPIGEGGAAGGPNPAVMLAAPGEQVARDRVLARVTTPIADVLRRCNRDSHNLYAEALLKRIAHETTKEPGSWAGGAAVLRMLLSEKIDPEAAAETVIADGSGMSRDNLVSARTLARWLVALAAESPTVSGAFIDSLARPGEGTLRDRFRSPRPRNQVCGKSGYIRGVRSLSGYLTTPDGSRRVAYAILINGVREDAGLTAKRLHESIVLEADRWLTRQGAREKPNLGG